MYGPNWSDPRRGVTGELKDAKPDYITVTDSRTGETKTVVGEAADEIRARLV